MPFFSMHVCTSCHHHDECDSIEDETAMKTSSNHSKDIDVDLCVFTIALLVGKSKVQNSRSIIIIKRSEWWMIYRKKFVE